MTRQRTHSILATIVLFVLASPASATILTFDGSAFPNEPAGNADPLEALPIDDAYGDRVTSTSQNGGQFLYGVGDEGFTPNVVVSYGSSQSSVPQVWRYDYGDLTRVIYQPELEQRLIVRFYADPGYQAVVNGIDLGGWFQDGWIINGVFLNDLNTNTQLFSSTFLLVNGSGPSSTHVAMGPAFKSSALELSIDVTNLGVNTPNVGLDNVRFSQVLIPEPSSGLLAALAALAAVPLAATRFRRR